MHKQICKLKVRDHRPTHTATLCTSTVDTSISIAMAIATIGRIIARHTVPLYAKSDVVLSLLHRPRQQVLQMLFRVAR
jgi:hypothetical protein